MANNKVVIGATINADGSQAIKTVQSFKQELRQASEEVVKIQHEFGDLSPQALAAAKRVAELRDKIQEAREVSELFDPGAKFKAFTNVAAGLASGFGAVQGSMALLGGQSQEVEQAILKVQSALALSQGLSTLGDISKDFSRLKTIVSESSVVVKANAVANKAAAFTMRLFGGSVEATSSSFKFLKGAIAATGIGLLLVLVSEAVGFFKDLSNAAADAAEAEKNALEMKEKYADVGLKGEQAYLNRKEQIEVAKARIAGKSEKEIFDIQQMYQKQRLSSLNRYSQEIGAEGEAGVAAKEQIKDLENKIQVDGLEFQAAANKKKLDDLKAANEKAAQLSKQRIDAARRLNEELRKEGAIGGAGSEQDRELAKLQQEYDAKRTILIQGGENTLELERVYLQKRLEIFEKYNKERQDKFDDATKEENKKNFDRISEQIEQEKAAADLKVQNKQKEVDNIIAAAAGVVSAEGMSYQERMAIISTGEANLLANTSLTQEQRTMIEQAFSNARKEIARTEKEAKRDMLNQEASLLDASAELAGKSTAAGKALAVAATLISTYTSAQKAYESQFLPVPDPTSPVRGAIAAATAAIGGLAKVKAIASVPVPGQSGGGGIAGGVSAPLQPTLTNSTTQLNPNQVAQINNQGNQAIKAYVVTTDINSDSERIARINRAARLG